MGDLSSVWDWSFFWGIFAFILQLVSPFVMIVVAIIAVGLLIMLIIRAIRNRE